MANVKYTDQLYKELLDFSDALDCFKAFVDLQPENSDEPLSSMEIIRNHSNFLHSRFDYVFEVFSSLSASLQLHNIYRSSSSEEESGHE